VIKISELIIQKIAETIKQVAIQENAQEIKVLVDLLLREMSKTSSSGEIIRYTKRDKQFLRKMIVETQRKALINYPEYYQGLIVLGLAYFEVQNYKKASETTNTAHQILNQLGMHRSEWVGIAMELYNATGPRVGEYPDFLDYLDDVENEIKQRAADKAGNTLKCLRCGNFNPPKSKFCLICGNKFGKKEKKK
jgi:hypothetical protein